MALGPKQMGDAIIRNLKEKTGKTLQEWITIVKDKNLADKKEIITFLKTENGLGHFQAQKIYEHFNGQDKYQDPSTFAKEIFDTKALSELYDFLKSKLLELGNDVRIQPCKTYIPFYRQNQFAILTKSKSGGITLGLNLPENYNNPKFSNHSKKGSERINAEALIGKTTDFDQLAVEAITTAYKTN